MALGLIWRRLALLPAWLLWLVARMRGGADGDVCGCLDEDRWMKEGGGEG